jgi:hypothetical protein
VSKFIVTIYNETYTDYIVEAGDEDEAKDLAMMGEYDEIDDVVIKDSEAINVKELNNE